MPLRHFFKLRVSRCALHKGAFFDCSKKVTIFTVIEINYPQLSALCPKLWRSEEQFGHRRLRHSVTEHWTACVPLASITLLSIFLLIGCGFRKLAGRGVESQA